MSRHDLQALQLKKLRRTLERVYHLVPFYGDKFDRAGVRIKSFRSLKQLQELPFTTKKDLWDHYPLGLLTTPAEKLARIHGSSGTKGRSTLVAYTQGDIRRWAELCARSLVAGGVRAGMRIHNAYGYGLFTGGLGFHYGAELLPATVIPVSGGNTLRQVRLLEDLQSEVLCCTPSFALHLADVRERQENKKPLSLRYGFFGAEPWTEAMRKQIEARLGLEALDHYGLSEIIGPGVAQECLHEKNGLHIWEDAFLPEVVHPGTGAVLPLGEEGELVLTTLEKEALPLIRYCTGDITALEPDPCRCGRTHIRMRKVKGRLDDMLIIRGVNLYPSEVETVLLQFGEVLPFYEIVVEREESLDRLSVRVECLEDVAAQRNACAGLTRKIQCALHDSCGLLIEVICLPPQSLPRSEGKALHVIDKRAIT